MLYKAYHEYRRKQLEAQRAYDEILAEKELLFSMTQPKSVKYGYHKSEGGSSSDVFVNYLVSKEKKRIDERLTEIKSILEDRTRLVKLKEQELRESKDYYDQIYISYFIDRMTVSKIKYKVPYSSSQIFRALDLISLNCGITNSRLHRAPGGKNMGLNETKHMLKYK